MEGRPPPSQSIKTTGHGIRRGTKNQKEEFGREGNQPLEELESSEVLGTRERSTSVEKLTGLSSHALLNLAGWIRSLSNCSSIAGGIFNCRSSGRYLNSPVN